MHRTHSNCKNSHCRDCYSDHMKLEEHLKICTATGKKYDLLGRYHKWLSENGIPPETEWGWASDESFEDTNIKKFCIYIIKLETQEEYGGIL